jgi:hypothetical protein
VLNQSRPAALLFDLLTAGDELKRANVFDIELLAGRLVDATRWLRTQAETDELPIGSSVPVPEPPPPWWRPPNPAPTSPPSCRAVAAPT